MRSATALVVVTGIMGSACSPYPEYVYQRPIPLMTSREQQQECIMIRKEIGRQLSIAELSGVMATGLVEASVRMNVSDVISGLQMRAAIAGCPA
jgi:hypothetical protein